MGLYRVVFNETVANVLSVYVISPSVESAAATAIEKWVHTYYDPATAVRAVEPVHDTSGYYVIYSPNESAIRGSMGFWNNRTEWGYEHEADVYTTSDKEYVKLPPATGDDAEWVAVSALLMEK